MSASRALLSAILAIGLILTTSCADESRDAERRGAWGDACFFGSYGVQTGLELRLSADGKLRLDVSSANGLRYSLAGRVEFRGDEANVTEFEGEEILRIGSSLRRSRGGLDIVFDPRAGARLPNVHHLDPCSK